MHVIERNVELTMVRAALDALPRHPLPEGFTLRWYQSGDDREWTAVQRAADRYNELPASLFGQVFGTNEELLTQRVAFLVDSRGQVVGTAAAWWSTDGSGERIGRVHWVAVHPAMQGRGLAKSLMAAVCLRLVELGERRAYLTISSTRLRAICLYLQFGFEPVMCDAAADAAWRSLEPWLVRAPTIIPTVVAHADMPVRAAAVMSLGTAASIAEREEMAARL
jgi:GNAT superfamily N-acetyltransferase